MGAAGGERRVLVLGVAVLADHFLLAALDPGDPLAVGLDQPRLHVGDGVDGAAALLDHRHLLAGAAGVAAGLLATLSCASAHITLEQQQAPVASSYKGVMRVPHGCDGAATTSIRIRIPAGVLGVKPMPKPGWQLNVTTGKYPKPYMLRGTPVTEGVTEISWSGGKLADAHYDEFVFIGVIAEEADGDGVKKLVSSGLPIARLGDATALGGIFGRERTVYAAVVRDDAGGEFVQRIEVGAARWRGYRSNSNG